MSSSFTDITHSTRDRPLRNRPTADETGTGFLTKAHRKMREGLNWLCWPQVQRRGGHLQRSGRGRCCGGRGTRLGTPSSPGTPSLPARRGERWTPPPLPKSLGCPSARTPLGRDPATARKKHHGEMAETGPATPTPPPPPRFAPQTCTAR